MMKNQQRMRPMMEEYVQQDTSSSTKPTQEKVASHYEQNVNMSK